MKQLPLIKKLLNSFYYHEGIERVGFVIPENEIVEVKNRSENPLNSFLVSPQDIIEFTETKQAIATWHTHPNQSANLSGEDYKIFKSWPKLIHFIVGNDGVKAFKFDEQLQDIIEI